MLVSLYVKNFAIIDEVMLDFCNGFNVLTGETGAGKSILIGSLMAALGGKMSKDMLGSRGDYAQIELVFESDTPELRSLFEENDLIFEEQTVISRRIALNGRSVCRINGETVSASVLKEISGLLIDIHGQHEHQSLLYKSGQRKIVDAYSKNAQNLAAEVRVEYLEYKRLKDAYEEASGSGRLGERELDLLRYELEEIENAKLVIGEDEELEERFKILSNADKISEALGTCSNALCDDNGSAADKVDMALKALGRVSVMDKELADYFDELNLIAERMSDLNYRIKDYLDEASSSGEELSEVSRRLDLVNHLKNKYGNSIEKVLDYMEECRRKLDEYSDYDSTLTIRKKELDKKYQELLVCAEKLTKEREKAAKKLSENVTEALKELNFQYGQLEIRLLPLEEPGENGAEELEFYISTNLGEPLKKLSQVASGGELSRIMLAIKSCMAIGNGEMSLVFDEIDTGISGRTAQKVSEKMAYISAGNQVICITHLPQIAAMADRHFLIEKEQSEGKTTTGITVLDKDGMCMELARMLGGATITEGIVASASEMKALADSWKEENKPE